MVAIAGFREAEYFEYLVSLIDQELKDQLEDLYAGFCTAAAFMKLVTEMLHAFWERMDDELGIKGDEDIRCQLAKLPFALFENPTEHVQVYVVVIRELLASQYKPYDAQRIFKWSRDKFCNVVAQIREKLEQEYKPLHYAILDPQMPAFLREEVIAKGTHLGLVKFIQPKEVKILSKRLETHPRPRETLFITAPYSSVCKNYIQENYKGKRSQQDYINTLKTHFAVKRLIDASSIEVHIFRTPYSMDSEQTRNKVDEFRKSSGNEGFPLAGADVLVDGKVVNVSFVNLLWVFDGEYFNEWPPAGDYGFVTIVQQDELERQIKQETEKRLQTFLNPDRRFVSMEERKARALMSGWTKKEQDTSTAAKQVRQVKLFFGNMRGVALPYHQTPLEQIKLDGPKQQDIIRAVKTPQDAPMPMREFKLTAHDYIHNQYYDASFEAWLKQTVIEKGLAKEFTRKLVEVNGQKLDISSMLRKPLDIQFGPENCAVDEPGFQQELDQVYDWDRDFYARLRETWRVSSEMYVCMRNSIIAQYRKAPTELMTPLIASQLVGLSFFEAADLVHLLEAQQLINGQTFNATHLGPQIPPPGQQQYGCTKLGTADQVLYQDPLLIKAAQLAGAEVDYAKVAHIIQEDQKLQIELQASNAVCGRFEKQ